MTERTPETIEIDDAARRTGEPIAPGIVAIGTLLGGLVIVATLAVGFARLLLDASPNAANVRYSQIVSNDAPSPDGVATLGLFAHAEDDPLTVGAERTRTFRHYLAEHEGRREPPDVSDYPVDRRLARPGASCWILDRRCLHAVVRQGMTLEGELAEHAVLLERFDRWLAAEDARPPVDPSRIGWAGPGPHLLGALRLRLARDVVGADAGDAASAARLEHTLTRLRVRLAQADSLVEKMTVARMVSLTLDGLALSTADGSEAGTLPALTGDERSMTRPFASEFRHAHDAFRSVLVHQDRDAPVRNLFFRAARAVLDVESSANAVANRLAAQEAMAALPRAEFDEARVRHAVDAIRPSLDPGNLIGSWILAADDEPDYTPYVAYLHGLDQKIASVNRLRAAGGDVGDACDGVLDCVATVIDDTGHERVCPVRLAAPSKPSFSCLPLASFGTGRKHSIGR